MTCELMLQSARVNYRAGLRSVKETELESKGCSRNNASTKEKNETERVFSPGGSQTGGQTPCLFDFRYVFCSQVSVFKLSKSAMGDMPSLDSWSIEAGLLRDFDCFGPTPYSSGPLPVPRNCLFLYSFGSQGLLLEHEGHVTVMCCAQYPLRS